MDTQLQLLIEDFYAVVNLFNQVKNKRLHFEGLTPVNTVALHLIEVIGDNPEKNATEIASVLGVTKGAVSQQVAKLKAKGLIVRRNEKNNNKELFFTLTEEGRRLYFVHKQLHEEMYLELQKLIDPLDQEAIEKVHIFMRNVEMYITRYAEKLSQ